LARRVLSAPRFGFLILVLALNGCRRDERAPAPAASASAAGAEFTERARAGHFQEELARARSRWQAKPKLDDCATALKEKADLALCEAAANALSEVTEQAPTTVEATLARLAPAALALARLSERLRYLTLQDLAERRVQGDAGVAGAAPSASAITRSAPAHSSPRLEHAERAVKLDETPVSRQLDVAFRLEHDVIRNLGAYLEYGPLPVRRAAFDVAKNLRTQHPRWPALDHLLNEASVLEADAALARDLRRLSASDARERRSGAAQSADTK